MRSLKKGRASIVRANLQKKEEMRELR